MKNNKSEKEIKLQIADLESKVEYLKKQLPVSVIDQKQKKQELLSLSKIYKDLIAELKLGYCFDTVFGKVRVDFHLECGVYVKNAILITSDKFASDCLVQYDPEFLCNYIINNFDNQSGPKELKLLSKYVSQYQDKMDAIDAKISDWEDKYDETFDYDKFSL